MSTKRQRHQRIRELLGSQTVANQEQLQEMLRAKNIEATQATLSRDLREIGVVKGPAGYQLPEALPLQRNGAVNGTGKSILERVLPSELLSAEAGGNLVVLRTQPAHANTLAIEIDRAQLPEVMGTIAGDDAVFVAARNAAQANRILRMFRKMAGLN
ncbi:MAG: hypothetical protein L0219_19170 [Phycisphaerales bacterium]|nr:hypothetical protein [Phycisphaerales bacterium]